MTSIKLYILSLTLIFIISSCSNSDTHREEGKIFHAAPSTGGIGALYFGLYNDNTYQICNSGGLGQDCYSAKFKLNKDTLMLADLNKDIPLKSNKLLIIRFAEQDSSYWKLKYFDNPNSWQDLKRQDAINSLGDVYQLDKNNQLMRDKLDEHFIIRLDSLKNHHHHELCRKTNKSG